MSKKVFTKKYQALAKEVGIDYKALEDKVEAVEKIFCESKDTLENDVKFITYTAENFTVGEMAFLKICMSDSRDDSFTQFAEIQPIPTGYLS